MVISEIDMTPRGVARSGNMGKRISETPEGLQREPTQKKSVHSMSSRLRAPVPQEVTHGSRCALQCEVVVRPVRMRCQPRQLFFKSNEIKQGLSNLPLFGRFSWWIMCASPSHIACVSLRWLYYHPINPCRASF